MSLASEADTCRQLWVAVFNAAARDLVMGDPNGLAASQARSWIGGRDFTLVCELIGVCPRRAAANLRALDARYQRAYEAERAQGKPRAKLKNYWLETLLGGVCNVQPA